MFLSKPINKSVYFSCRTCRDVTFAHLSIIICNQILNVAIWKDLNFNFTLSIVQFKLNPPARHRENLRLS